MGKVSEFAGRRCIVATGHGKERVIGPLLVSGLGVELVPLDSELNTDALGTFSGEIERKLGVDETLLKKCRMGLLAGGTDLAVASEGSFGPHPVLPFAALNEERVMLSDASLGLQVVGRHATARTNYAACNVTGFDELLEFAARARFPSHHVMLRNAEGAWRKGISTESDLRSAWEDMKSASGVVWVETDMRAMCNPTRMDAIERATQDLVERLKARCSRCAKPGVGWVRWVPGLPCSVCGSPTEWPRKAVHECPHCHNEVQLDFPQGMRAADPGNCPQCNP